MGVEIKYWKDGDKDIVWAYWTWTNQDRNKQNGKICAVKDELGHPLNKNKHVVVEFTGGSQTCHVDQLSQLIDIPSSLRHKTIDGYLNFYSAYSVFESRMNKTNMVNGPNHTGNVTGTIPVTLPHDINCKVQWKEVSTKEHYPHKCPMCDKPAYINLFGTIDCSCCEGKH